MPAFSGNPSWTQNQAMTTVTHLLSIVDYNLLISDLGLKFYKIRMVGLKYKSWAVCPGPHFIHVRI